MSNIAEKSTSDPIEGAPYYSIIIQCYRRIMIYVPVDLTFT